MIIENICVATDGSDVAVRAAQMAVLLARTGAKANGVACDGLVKLGRFPDRKSFRRRKSTGVSSSSWDFMVRRRLRCHDVTVGKNCGGRWIPRRRPSGVIAE
jgi:hypothetical protein